MISSFNQYREEILLESINESIIYFSPKMSNTLNRIKNNPIAKALLGVESTDVTPDMTFVDIAKSGYVSFITMRNAKNVISKNFNDPWAVNIDKDPISKKMSEILYDLDMDTRIPEDKKTNVYLKSRNEVALGKFVNKIFPSKFSDKQREEFVNQFKSTFEKQGLYFDLVSGDEIDFWYSHQNYSKMSGTLGNSCMAKKEGLFQIYTQNPDLCKLLVLIEDNKLIGRALVWKVHTFDNDKINTEWFMDRQYTIEDSDVIKFKNYADEKGWAYKTNNNHFSLRQITFKDAVYNVEMQVKLGDKNYTKFPYMDTFRRYDPEKHILYNDDNDDSVNEGQYILDSTDGSYMEIEGGNYSEYHDCRIPDGAGIWSVPLNSWIWEDEAVEVRDGSEVYRGWYPRDFDDITLIDNRWYHINDCHYSDIINDYVIKGNAVRIVGHVYSDGDVPLSEDQWLDKNSPNIVWNKDIEEMDWYKYLTKEFSDWLGYKGILKRLLVKDFEGNWILDEFSESIWRVDRQSSLFDEKTESPANLGNIEYLTDVDAEILGWEITPGEENKRIVDIIRYNKDIQPLIESIRLRAKFFIEENSKVEPTEYIITQIDRVRRRISLLKELND